MLCLFCWFGDTSDHFYVPSGFRCPRCGSLDVEFYEEEAVEGNETHYEIQTTR